MGNLGRHLAVEAFTDQLGDMGIALGLGIGLATEDHAGNGEDGDDGNPEVMHGGSSKESLKGCPPAQGRWAIGLT